MDSVLIIALCLVQARAMLFKPHLNISAFQENQLMSLDILLYSPELTLVDDWTTLEQGVEKRRNVQADYIVDVTTPLLLDSNSLWVGGSNFTEAHLGFGVELSKAFSYSLYLSRTSYTEKPIYHVGKQYVSRDSYICRINHVCVVTISLLKGRCYRSLLQYPTQLSLSDMENKAQHELKWTRLASVNYTYTFPGLASAKLYFIPVSFGVLQQKTTKDRYHLTSFHQETSVRVAPIKVELFHDGFISIKVSNFMF
ncbi:hypothetical protein DSO57_1015688 [Entomophthora muscae]|uniref:Uncharacterized protein n=1 Tax=Entomophthora muscae TaxID=34485 RepID=A0ACC2RJR3_9FUNG|nr:hypothetical protein DSO57_1015688 [Entomophthora muscae]